MTDFDSFDVLGPVSRDAFASSTVARPAFHVMRLRLRASRVLQQCTMLVTLGAVVFAVSAVAAMSFPGTAPFAVVLMLGSTASIVLAMSVASLVAIASLLRESKSV